MAEFSDTRMLDRQSKSREVRTVKDPKKLALMKLAGFDHMGRSTGWGKAMDWIDPFATVHMRNAIAKKAGAGTDARRVHDETRDEFLAMNLGQHKFTADIFKTIFGGKGMGAGMGAMGQGMGGMFGKMGAGGAGASAGAAGAGGGVAGAAGGGGGFGNFLGNVFGGGGGQGANMMKTAGNIQQGMNIAQGVGENVSGAMQTEGADNGVVDGTSNSNLKQNFPDGVTEGPDGYLYDQEGNRVDYDIASENAKPENMFNNLGKNIGNAIPSGGGQEDVQQKNKDEVSKTIKGVLNPNADLIGSATNMITKGIDYYNAQEEEVKKLRGIQQMNEFNLL